LLATRCTEAFLILRAAGLGVAPQWTPIALVAMNLVAAPVTPLAGILSDRFGRRRVILLGFLVLALSHGVLAGATEPWLAFAGAALWGAHLGLTQGVFSAFVADLAPAEIRGTAFGVFHLVSGSSARFGPDGAGMGPVGSAARIPWPCLPCFFLSLPAARHR
jgi:MFS family permease